MDGILQTMPVDAPAKTVRQSWPTFMEEVLVAGQKLACSQLMCVDAVAAGLVDFEALGSQRTLVTFRIPPDRWIPAAGGDAELASAVGDRLRRDLIRFKDYVESRGTAAGSDTSRSRPGVRESPPGAAAASARPADPTRQA